MALLNRPIRRTLLDPEGPYLEGVEIMNPAGGRKHNYLLCTWYCANGGLSGLGRKQLMKTQKGHYKQTN